MRRGALAIVLAVALGGLPAGASAQERAQPAGAVPYAIVDIGSGDPYEPRSFERAGTMLPALRRAIIDASLADESGLRALFGGGVGGFARSAPGGVALVGRTAPVVAPGGLLGVTSRSTSTSGATSTSSLSSAIPARGSTSSAGRRTTFAFTDDTGAPVPPPADLAPLDPVPSRPTEGVTAAPPPSTTTTTAPPASAAGDSTTSTSVPTSAAPSTSTTAPAATTSTTSTTAPARPTTTAPGPATSTTLPPATPSTSTTLPPVASTTTTTQPTVTTTTVAPPTTTTTVPPPSGTFSLTQERPSMTACVATAGSSAACDALYSVAGAAPNTTRTFDLTLRNSGDVDASALQMWASTPCATTSTGSPSGTGDLCAAIQLTVQRYTTDARDVPLECVYGGGTAQLCSLSSARTLAHLSSAHGAAEAARSIGTGFAGGASAHLRITIHLPDVDNRFQQRAATLGITWRQVQ